MSFNPTRLGYEAGVTLWWNQYSHASIGIAVVGEEGSEKVTVITREPTGTNGEIKVSHPFFASSTELGAGPVELSIVARATDYTLSLISGDSSTSIDVSSEVLTIFPPVGGAFCGAMFGLYSFGKNEPVLDPADFSDVEISEV